jgi:uncharacterized membrane protein
MFEERIMTFLRNLLLLALLLGTAAGARAQRIEVYTLKVCNKGDLKFHVAVAAKVPGWISDDWEVDGWITIKPKDCAEVYHHELANEGKLFAHVAFAFTDSTGAFGPIILGDKSHDKSSFKFCGTREDFHYPHPPANYCIDSQFVIPASLDYDAGALHIREPIYINGTPVYSGHEADENTLDVVLTAKDRVSVVIAKSSGGASSSGNSASSSSSGASSGKSGWDTFVDVMKNVLDEAAREDRDRKRREQAAAAAEADRVPPTPPKALPPPERPTEQPPESKPSTVPPIDPNDDPFGAGGFITPHETEMVRKEAQVCVPMTIVNHEWNSPPPGGKMEAFKSAAKKMIREEAGRIRVGDNTQFMIVDIFDSFDPATTDPLGLVYAVSGKHDCPAESHPYTLTVETNP